MRKLIVWNMCLGMVLMGWVATTAQAAVFSEPFTDASFFDNYNAGWDAYNIDTGDHGWAVNKGGNGVAVVYTAGHSQSAELYCSAGYLTNWATITQTLPTPSTSGSLSFAFWDGYTGASDLQIFLADDQGTRASRIWFGGRSPTLMTADTSDPNDTDLITAADGMEAHPQDALHVTLSWDTATHQVSVDAWNTNLPNYHVIRSADFTNTSINSISNISLYAGGYPVGGGSDLNITAAGLTISYVPEPATMGLLLGGLLMGVWRRRRA